MSEAPKENSEQKKTRDQDKELGARMTFIEHLEELRRRLIISIVTVGACMIAVYGTSANVLRSYFLLPIQQILEETGSGSIMFTAPTEGFLFDLKISAIAGLFAASPMLFYQFWAFVAPGLYKKERGYTIPFIFFSTVCFIGGAIFAYLVILPIGYQFFSGFATEGVSFNPKLSEYFTFTVKLLLAFGVVFETPLIAFFAARLGLVDYKFLIRNFKYFLVLAVILGAIFTPPDPLSQMLMAGPLIVLYMFSVLIVYLFGTRRKDKKEEEKDLAG